MTRKRLATDERRAQLLQLGVELFSRHPFDALTTDLIATEGGVSKGLLFHYFGSKRGFYIATIEHVADQLLIHVVLDPERAPLATVLDAVERFLDFVGEHAAIYRALLRGGLGADPQSQAIVERVRWTIVHRVGGLLSTGDVSGPVNAEPVTTQGGLRLYGWVGTVEALSLAWIDLGVERELIRSLILESFAPVLAAWSRDRQPRP
ncbi:MAG: TetR/AcrR family transcriptional regulator [Deltaproteobacteria bacterium]|nr:TetR/AcrR family transcriptional regulator [Deltaproteobacteria bacterium]